MSESKMEDERGMKEEICSITISQEMVRKCVREGSYLYLGRQSYLFWMRAKCQNPSQSENLNKGGRVLTWMDEVAMSWSELARL